jgi:hypothetical protein
MNWQTTYLTQVNKRPSLSMEGRRTLKTFCYFVGLFMVEVGFFGIIASIVPPSPSIVSIAMLFVLFLLSLITTLLFFHTCYHACCLSWSQYFWSILGATVGVAAVISPAAACSLDEKGILPVVFACSLLLYGMSLS